MDSGDQEDREKTEAVMLLKRYHKDLKGDTKDTKG